MPFHDHLRTALRELARAEGVAEIVARVSTAAMMRGVWGCVFDLVDGGLRPFVTHIEPARIAVGRVARGESPISQSTLARDSMARGEALHVRGGAPDDVLEHVRVAWGADELVVAPLGELGVLTMFGERISFEQVRAIELLAASAAGAISQARANSSLRAEVRARDAAVAVLTSLNESCPLPQAFFDASLRAIATNDAFVELVGREAADAGVSALGSESGARLRPAIANVIETKCAERLEIVERGRAYIVTVHPVRGLAAAGVTLVDVTTIHSRLIQLGAIADAATLMRASGSASTVIEVLTTTCARALGDAAVTLRADGAVVARAGDEALALERVARELLASAIARGPARVVRTTTADALSVDDLAHLPVREAPMHLLSVPCAREASCS